MHIWRVCLEGQSLKYSAMVYKLGTEVSWNTAKYSQKCNEIFKIFEKK